MPSHKIVNRTSSRQRLRRATEAMHEAVDERFAGLLAEGPLGYDRFLATIAEAVVPLEEALKRAEIERHWPDWLRHGRTEALKADLAALNLEPPVGPSVPRLRGEAHQFGVLYVLEGSRLGAKVLLRDLSSRLDPDRLAATRYLTHGEGDGLWSRFLDRLEASDAVRQAPAEAEAGAMLAFSLFLPGASSLQLDSGGDTATAPARLEDA